MNADLACQYAVASQLRVIAIDTGADKRKLCESYGVDKFLDFKEVPSGTFVDEVRKLTGGLGPHVSLSDYYRRRCVGIG